MGDPPETTESETPWYKDVDAVTVALGSWVYDDPSTLPARVIALRFDYWHSLAEADGDLEEDEKPEPFGPEGLLYYAYLGQIRGPGFPTILQAKGYAQSLVRHPIAWSD